MLIWIDSVKVLDKTQYSFTEKTLTKLDIDRKFLLSQKSMFKKPMANITLNCKILNIFS